MSLYVVLMGYFIPPQGETGGPRAASRCVCQEEETDAQMAAALQYLELTGFECPMVEIMAWDEFLSKSKEVFEDLRTRVLDEWRAENPDKAFKDEPPLSNEEQIATNFRAFLGVPKGKRSGG